MSTAIELKAPRERVCFTCHHYGFKPGNPVGWRWACCEKRKFWFESDLDAPGLRKGCEDWE